MTVPGPPEICIVNPSSWPIMKLLSPAVQIYRTGQLDFGIVEIIAGIEAVLQIGECGVIQKRTDIISGRCGTSWLSPGTEQK